MSRSSTSNLAGSLHQHPSGTLQRISRRISLRTSNVTAFLGLAILMILLLLALFPARIAPYDPGELVGKPFQPPGPEFRLGTNDLGQDLFSELVWGTRTTWPWASASP